VSDVPRSVARIVDERDQYQCVHSARSLHVVEGSRDHRKLRSQGGPSTPSNLILLSGSGTTLSHGWKHANPRDARLLGYYVPVWAAPEKVPIRIIDPLFGLCWVLLADDGEKHWLSDDGAAHRMRELGIWQEGEAI
jgi:hypothetical protein